MVNAVPAATPAGAVYLPVESIVPTPELPPGLPLTDHVTVVLVVPVTVGVNCLPPPAGSVAVVSLNETLTPVCASAAELKRASSAHTSTPTATRSRLR